MHSFQLDYGRHGFRSITINLGDDWETIKSYARLYASLYLKDNGTVWPVWRQNGYIPLNYVVDTSGIIRYIAEGFNEPAMRQVIEQYLPDPIEHDVGVKRVVAPAGTVDSGTTVVPACTVHNYRNYTETYPVRMRVGSRYDTTVLVTNHAPHTDRYITFPEWTATERGQLVVSCSTELAGDDINTNDRYATQVMVNVYDLAVTLIIAPVDTVDSGTALIPKVQVRNFGNVADMARVRLTIGAEYVDSVNVPLQPGRCDTAEFRTWTATELGEEVVRCTVRGRWDMVPENNLVTGTVWVRSTGIGEQTLLGSMNPSLSAKAVFGDKLVLSLGTISAGSRLSVFDAHGRLVSTIPLPVGSTEVLWNGADIFNRELAPGVYWVRLTSNNRQAALKVVKTR